VGVKEAVGRFQGYRDILERADNYLWSFIPGSSFNIAVSWNTVGGGIDANYYPDYLFCGGACRRRCGSDVSQPAQISNLPGFGQHFSGSDSFLSCICPGRHSLSCPFVQVW